MVSISQRFKKVGFFLRDNQTKMYEDYILQVKNNGLLLNDEYLCEIKAIFKNTCILVHVCQTVSQYLYFSMSDCLSIPCTLVCQTVSQYLYFSMSDCQSTPVL